MKTILIALLGLLTLAAATRAEEKKPKYPQAPVAKADVRAYYEMLELNDADLRGTHLFWKLQDLYGDHETYTARQVLSLTDPAAFDEEGTDPDAALRDNRHGQPMPAGAVPADRVQRYFKTVATLARAQAADDTNHLAALATKYGDQPWYRPEEIREIEKNGDKPRKLAKPSFRKPKPVETAWRLPSHGLRSLKIRADWTDVLASEDATQAGGGPETLDDLVGAKLSYTRDAKKRTDATSVAGAIILPITWKQAVNGEDYWPEIFTVAPSVTISKLSTTGDAADEVDYIYGRLGLFGQWVFKKEGSDRAIGLVGRAAYVHATDTHGHGHLDGVELDLEPQVFPGPGRTGNLRSAGVQNGFGFGVRNIVIPKLPSLKDGSDKSVFDFQVRAWLHAENGQVQRKGNVWEAVEGTFLRAGPVVQGTLNFPTALRGISFTGKYSYLYPFQGPELHNNYLKLSSTLTLYEAAGSGQKLSLTAEVEKGSLILSKEYIETHTIGLSVVY